MKWCPECKTTKSKKDFYKNRARRDGLQSCCKKCRVKVRLKLYNSSEKYKKWMDDFRRLKAKRYYDKYKDENAIKARTKLKTKISSGKIRKRNSCEICHNSPTQCHHEDYSKPYEFIELCKRCHIKLHLQYALKGYMIPNRTTT